MSQYAELLTELDALPTLAKAETIPAAAAAEAAPEAPAETPAAEETTAEATAAEADATPAAEAEEAQAAAEVEGTEIPEGFVDVTEAFEEMRAALAEVREQVAQHGALLTKAASLVKSLHAKAGEQDGLIKAQAEAIERMGRTPAGRKGVLLAKAGPAPAAPPLPGDVLAKAQAAYSAGKLSAHDANRVVAFANRGMDLPADLAAQLAAL